MNNLDKLYVSVCVVFYGVFLMVIGHGFWQFIKHTVF